MLKKPAQIKSQLPAGCQQWTPAYELADTLGPNSSSSDVAAATRQWYDYAELEFCDIMGLSAEDSVAYRGRSEGASFVQKVPMGGRGSQHDGASEASAKWRTVAAWATVLMRALSLSSPTQGLKAHAEEIRIKFSTKHPWKLTNNVLEKELVDFCANFNDERLDNKECIAYLIKYATARAQILEGHQDD